MAAARAAMSVEDYLGGAWRGVKSQMGWTGQPRPLPYISYGRRGDSILDPVRVRLLGRVLTNRPLRTPRPDDDWWDNLARMYRRLDSDECPRTPVTLHVGQTNIDAVTDHEGFFDAAADADPPLPDDDPDNDHIEMWQSFAATLPEANDLPTRGRLMIPSRAARLGVISDIDDTILFTGVTDVATMAKLTFLHSAAMRSPLPGVAALYRALQGEGPATNPIFYVSSSPWNLFDLLVEFMELNHIPLGPLLLKDLGISERTFTRDGHAHKRRKAERIMDDFPDLPFVLIGDSGQEDATLYADIAERRPERVAMILIRDVDPGVISIRDSEAHVHKARAEAAGVAMHLIESSEQAARHLAEAGLLDAREIDAIAAATRRDREQATT